MFGKTRILIFSGFQPRTTLAKFDPLTVPAVRGQLKIHTAPGDVRISIADNSIFRRVSPFSRHFFTSQSQQSAGGKALWKNYCNAIQLDPENEESLFETL